ncbi:MAG: acetolactate synthase small subunit [Clostridiales bacterium]|nr:acetolactate synthase small subunit [Clostridiales bacterium]MDD7035968.1 acetolactate synthase small subunit [Bacillota bacterium]MDY2920476.1 acetolactate synthase small subunit [Lentihominibacter sp.]
MDRTERSEILSILVVNEPGVTARLGSLFARRGFNIDSFTASPTNDPTLTRITIATTGDDRKFDQILTQTAKQEFVKTVDIMDSKSIYRELLLLKVKAGKKDRSQIREIVEIYRGRIVDLSRKSLIIELTGSTEKIDGFMDMMSCYEIIDVCRTGVTGINRGDAGISDVVE